MTPRPPAGGLSSEVLAARRAELAARGETSRERRRPDERGAWVAELFAAIALVDDATAGRVEDDPRAALLDVAAIATAWIHAMDGRTDPP